MPGDVRKVFAVSSGEAADHSLTVDPPAGDAPILRDLYHYWDAVRGSRSMPSRADFDLGAVRALLPLVFMMDVVGADEYRFRLLGSEITRRYGRDSTSKTLRDVYARQSPALLEKLTRLMAAVVETPRPVLSRGSLNAVRKDHAACEAIHLPLSDDGSRVNIILGGTRFIKRAATGAEGVG